MTLMMYTAMEAEKSTIIEVFDDKELDMFMVDRESILVLFVLVPHLILYVWHYTGQKFGQIMTVCSDYR